jgi:hypothetical protein
MSRSFCKIAAKRLLNEIWSQKKFDRALKELSIGIKLVEIRLKTNE